MMTEIYAHRGFSSQYPENTLLAFQKAIELGVDGLEIDVQLTKDNEIVVIHDEHLGRTFEGDKYVQEYTLAEIKELKLSNLFKSFPNYNSSWENEKIPTLKEVLELLAGTSVSLNIELKTIKVPYVGMVQKVVDEVNHCDKLGKIIYSSFHYPTLSEIKKYDSHSSIAWLVPFDVPRVNEYVIPLALEGLHISKDVALAKPKQEFNFSERLWTVNNPNEMSLAISQGYTSIITDYPNIGIEVRDRLNDIQKA